MPLQNRVTPDGAIIAVPARGTFMGNRGGRIHDADRKLGRKRWSSPRWICCRLDWNDRRRPVMGPGYTELFFLDEATALAAGHRPCFECRRDAATRFAELFGEAMNLGRRSGADEMDRVLHAERLTKTGEKRTYGARIVELPDGAMFRLGHTVATKRDGRLAAWSAGGYSSLPAVALSGDRPVEVLTPPSIVKILRRGYRPRMDPSIEAAESPVR